MVNLRERLSAMIRDIRLAHIEQLIFASGQLFEQQLRKATTSDGIDITYLGELVGAAYDEANAAHAIEGSGKPLPGTISVRTARVGEFVEISVGDSGTVMA